MNEIMKITIEAKKENLSKILSFCVGFLNTEIYHGYRNNLLLVAVEEVFTNIASYAYSDEIGYAQLELVRTNENTIKATFKDSGCPFSPVEYDSNNRAKDNIDKLVPGGLGVYIVKNSMKNLKYERIGDCNVFSFETAAEEEE